MQAQQFKLANMSYEDGMDLVKVARDEVQAARTSSLEKGADVEKVALSWDEIKTKLPAFLKDEKGVAGLNNQVLLPALGALGGGTLGGLSAFSKSDPKRRRPVSRALTGALLGGLGGLGTAAALPLFQNELSKNPAASEAGQGYGEPATWPSWLWANRPDAISTPGHAAYSGVAHGVPAATGGYYAQRLANRVSNDMKLRGPYAALEAGKDKINAGTRGDLSMADLNKLKRDAIHSRSGAGLVPGETAPGWKARMATAGAKRVPGRLGGRWMEGKIDAASKASRLAAASDKINRGVLQRGAKNTWGTLGAKAQNVKGIPRYLRYLAGPAGAGVTYAGTKGIEHLLSRGGQAEADQAKVKDVFEAFFGGNVPTESYLKGNRPLPMWLNENKDQALQRLKDALAVYPALAERPEVQQALGLSQNVGTGGPS